ncbi:MAG: carbonic anhydrase [Chitinophagaceae bacterium]|nr:MAG: carbonic anhydrase [Chitinophagaceae bacterium]
MKIEKIFANNKNWIKSKLVSDENYFENLATGQSPDILYIGCSDSRVTAEDMMGAQPGEIFVHRNIANMVPNNDLNVTSVINYAVNHLKVNHIVVCGHYYCGGVKAAMESSDLGLLNLWLDNIKEVYRLHKKELNAISSEDERYKRLVQLNVEEQCINILKISEVQAALRERGFKVHGWVFDIKSGKLIDLNIDFKKIAENVGIIFDFRDQ